MELVLVNPIPFVSQVSPMIDMHTHLLPGIDDGAADWTETLRLARAAAAEGITEVVATPHHANGRDLNPASGVLELVREANDRLAAAGIPLTVRPGQEIRVHDDLLDAWSRGELLALNQSNYVLIELPPDFIPKGMPDLLHELDMLGLRAVIAHPERNAEIVRHPERLGELVEAGAYAQVTAHSLLGGFGKRIERQAWSLCERGWIHLVASDAHHVDRRGFRLLQAYDRIGQELGAVWRQTAENNARRLLIGGSLDSSPVIHAGERSLWRKISGIFT